MERLLKQVLDDASEAILVSDKTGIIIYWNKGAERMFGHNQDEAMGKTLDLIIPENLRTRHWNGYNRVMQSGESKYKTELLSSPGIRKDGSRISLEFSMVLLHDEFGNVCGCASIMRDATARWNREQELKDRLKIFVANTL